MGREVAVSNQAARQAVADDPEARRIVDGLIGFRNSAGAIELRRALSPAERETLDRRRRELQESLKPAYVDDVTDEVLKMFLGFGGSRQDENDMAMTATQYAVALGGLPFWAVERSCLRWAQHRVTPAEVGEKSISWSFAPSASMVRFVADKIVEPYVAELAQTTKVLQARYDAPMTDAERAAAADRVGAKLKATKQHFAALEEAQERAASERRSAAAARSIEITRRMADAEFERAGVERPESCPTASLSLLLSVGWTIAERKGRKQLVPPAAPKRRETQPHEMGS